MPIRPENKARYPKDWKQISLRILQFTARQCWSASDIARTVSKRISNALMRAGDRAWAASDKARKS